MEARSSASGPAPSSASLMIDRATAVIRDHLPPTWAVAATPPSQDDADPSLTLTSPDASALRLSFTVRRTIDGRDVPGLVDRLSGAASHHVSMVPVLTAAYLSPTVRQRLRTAGLAHVDATGNIWISAAHPGLLISATGAVSDPWRGPGRPRGTLKGAPAAKVVRALLDFSQPWAVRELIQQSTASVGATYRVLDHLEREGLITRDDAVVVPSWRALLEAWARDYDFFRAGAVSTWIAPRGLPWLLRRTAESDDVAYAVTGTFAVPEGARHAAPRAAMIYVDNAAHASDVWDLRPAEVGQNVLLCEAPKSPAFQRATPTRADHLVPDRYLTLVRPAQVAVDLLNGPGRGPEEALALLEWMERDEDLWRV